MKQRKNDPPMVAELIKAWGLADELSHILCGKLYRDGPLLVYLIGQDSAHTLRANIKCAIDMVRKIARQVKT